MTEQQGLNTNRQTWQRGDLLCAFYEKVSKYNIIVCLEWKLGKFSASDRKNSQTLGVFRSLAPSDRKKSSFFPERKAPDVQCVLIYFQALPGILFHLVPA